MECRFLTCFVFVGDFGTLGCFLVYFGNSGNFGYFGRLGDLAVFRYFWVFGMIGWYNAVLVVLYIVGLYSCVDFLDLSGFGICGTSVF